MRYLEKETNQWNERQLYDKESEEYAYIRADIDLQDGWGQGK